MDNTSHLSKGGNLLDENIFVQDMDNFRGGDSGTLYYEARDANLSGKARVREKAHKHAAMRYDRDGRVYILMILNALYVLSMDHALLQIQMSG
jgi:hypothetical protein